jgi:hypothetical protein
MAERILIDTQVILGTDLARKVLAALNAANDGVANDEHRYLIESYGYVLAYQLGAK